jgi:hypothetical protein
MGAIKLDFFNFAPSTAIDAVLTVLVQRSLRGGEWPKRFAEYEIFFIFRPNESFITHSSWIDLFDAKTRVLLQISAGSTYMNWLKVRLALSLACITVARC